MKTVLYLIFGFAFGALLLSSGAFSWTVIYRMFHFESFHMFGLLFSAIATGAVSVFLLKKSGVKSLNGNVITIKEKPLDIRNNLTGGLLFGIGWGITGACTAPLYLLIGIETKMGLLMLCGAVSGVILYGFYSNLLSRNKKEL